MSYLEGHIPGAIYSDLNQDLSGPITKDTGRHPLPDPGDWIEKLSTWGVEPGKQVVAYDTTGGSYASRLWWMLRWMGHYSVALLDGGYAKWASDGRAVSIGDETGKPGSFRGSPDNNMILSAQEVEEILGDTHFRIIDARARARYLGIEEPFDTIAGHIPGAVNRFHVDNLKPDGTFLGQEVLRDEFHKLLRGIPSEHSIVYCGSGVTSCHHLVAMEIAGLPGARLYAGSWSEWIRNPNRPRAAGS